MKILSYILIVIYLSFSTGITLYEHICGGEIKSVSVKSSSEDCCDQSESSCCESGEAHSFSVESFSGDCCDQSKSSCCEMDEINCCSEEVVVLKIEDSQDNVKTNKGEIFITSLLLQLITDKSEKSKKQFAADKIFSDKLKVPLYLFHSELLV